MSRIGKNPISLPAKVTVDVDKANYVKVNGPKGSLAQQLSPDIEVKVEKGVITLHRPTDLGHHKEQHGLARTLLNNMIVGVTNGFSKRLEIVGVGYRAEKRGSNLVLQVGKSHPVEFTPPSKDIVFEVDKDGRNVTITGVDKCVVGELAATIRNTRPPEPYQGKGIRYAGEYVKLKVGKTGKTGKGGKK
jgi:large subunit ribosomal protein L6